MEFLPYATLLNYSLAGVAAIGLVEKFIPVMPSYIMLVLFGMTLVNDNGDLSAIVLCSTAGSILGGGRSLSLPLEVSEPNRLLLSTEDIF